MTDFSLCIHGHFYQPPREDPFTGVVPQEQGSEPYANWNERILAECYLPNARLRNFERISFNIGPTLFEWMRKFSPQVCAEIVQQDQANLRYYGVGNALAQPFHHTILPLATRREKQIQIRWGIAQFVLRMGRRPAGIWLPETAVDYETLELLADEGIQFTILAPWQSAEPDLDTTQAYWVGLPNQKKIQVVFYHQELSGGISFNPAMTENADAFVEKELLKRFQTSSRTGRNRLILIATDGELYGHHQHFRDHFLAHLVNGASHQRGISPTNLAWWLKQHPPTRFITIREDSSWSCHHGVLRWKGDCECLPTDGTWKVYLRQACESLAQDVDKVFSDTLHALGLDPWALLDKYIQVILQAETLPVLMQEFSSRSLKTEEYQRIAWLLEAQHQRHRMFTSCAWFFEDFARIEPKNCLAYAAQTVNLTNLATGNDFSAQMLANLKHVVSHRTGLRGDYVFQQQMERAQSYWS